MIHKPHKPAQINLYNIPKPNLQTRQITRTKAHNQLSHNRISLLICRRRSRRRRPVLMHVHPHDHGNDIQLAPQRRAQVRSELEERFPDPRADEFAAVLLGKGADLVDAVAGEFLGAFGVVVAALDFVQTKVDRVVRVVDGQTDFDVGLVLEHACREADVELLQSTASASSRNYLKISPPHPRNNK
jgi:hypothetical protein